MLIAMLIAVPIALYHGIEKPMIKIGVWLAERASAGPVSAVLARPNIEGGAPALELREEIAS